MSNSNSGIYLFIYSPVWLVHRHSSILEAQNSQSPFLLALQQPADVGNRETALYTNVFYAGLTGGGRDLKKNLKTKGTTEIVCVRPCLHVSVYLVGLTAFTRTETQKLRKYVFST